MAIVLQNVAPVYLEKEKTDRSGIWNRHVVLEKAGYIQVTAPSGSGKTSFTHFIYGLRTDYSGKISIDGADLSMQTAEEISFIRRRKLSVVFQDMRLFADHTLLENILVKKQLDPFEGAASANEMAATLGIERKLSQPAKRCSYGEQQRAAIIRALQQPFDYLLLDEPFSHLDDRNRDIAMQLILDESKKRQASIIMADLEPYDGFPSSQNLVL